VCPATACDLPQSPYRDTQPSVSENIAIFSSVLETATLRGCETLEIFEALLTEPPGMANEISNPMAARAG
jgi:hypothetical protein